MDAIDASQFADTPIGLIVGQQRLYLDRGQAPLDLTFGPPSSAGNVTPGRCIRRRPLS
jgi:hypothetical protein